jgi:hypothetical protein
MSEGDTFWISLAEKFFGLLLTIIGALSLYLTLTSTSVYRNKNRTVDFRCLFASPSYAF